MADALGDPLDFEVVVAGLRMGREGAGEYLSGLATKLDRALPGLVTVERSGWLSRQVKAVTCELSGRRYRVTLEAARLRCTIASVVHGVVIRTDESTLDDWVAQLSRELAKAAEESQDTRAALERLLG